MILRKGFLLLLLTLSGCSGHAESVKECKFSYTKDMEETLVIPLAKKVLGEEKYKFYDYEDPTVLDKGEEIWLFMGPVKTIDGYRLMNEDSFIIVLEKCTNKYIDYFIQSMN